MPGAEPPESGGELICVLLHEESAAPAVRLLEALAKKNIQVRSCTDPFLALALLARSARDRGVSLPILLLHEPHGIERKAELAGLASVYAPRAVLWLYTAGPPEQVREVRDADLEGWRMTTGSEDEPAVIRTRPVEVRRPGPHLRIVPESESTPSAGGPGGDEAAPPGEAGDPVESWERMDDGAEADGNEEPLLTDEELSMLLSDEFEDERNGGRG